MRWRGIVAVVAGASAALGAVASLRHQTRRAIFQPPHSADKITVPDGMRLFHTPGELPVLYAPPSTAALPTVVYFHGNATDLAASTELLARLHAHGYGVAGIEYPGYEPHSTTTPTPRRAVEACVDAIALVARQPETDQFILVGHSLGTALATQVAAHGVGHRMLLAAPFTSTADLARHLVRWIPAWVLLDPRQLDSLRAAPSITIPVLIIHGDRDDQIPTWMGQRLAAAFPHGSYREIAGADHSTLADHLTHAIDELANTPA